MGTFVFRAPFSGLGIRLFVAVLAGLSAFGFIYQKNIAYWELKSTLSGLTAFLLAYIFLKSWSSKRIIFQSDRLVTEGFPWLPPVILASSIEKIHIINPIEPRSRGHRIEFVIRETRQKCVIPQLNDENWGKVIEWFDGIRLKLHVTKT